MKVLNLRCEHGHGFEGWFASEDDYQGQASRGEVACPLCGSPQVSKLPSAPRLNLSGAKRPSAGQDSGSPPGPPAGPASGAQAGSPSASGAEPQARVNSAAMVPAEVQALWLKTLQQVMAHTEDVGQHFAEEARKMHYGEVPDRGIRGQASPEEREALADEGIDVMPFPLPPGLKGSLQ